MNALIVRMAHQCRQGFSMPLKPPSVTMRSFSLRMEQVTLSKQLLPLLVCLISGLVTGTQRT